MDQGASADLRWRVRLDPPPLNAFNLQVSVDQERQTLAWRDDWNPGPFVHLHDAATGVELGRVVCAALQITATASGFVLLDHGWRVDALLPPRLLVLTRVGDGVELLRYGVAPETSQIGAAPDGDRMILFRPGRCELRRRSETGSVRTWDWYQAGVDWEAGCVWGADDHDVSLEALDGSWSRRLEITDRFPRVASVGCGVLRLGYHGIRLFRPRGSLLTLLRPTSQPIWAVSAGDGGGAASVILGWKPRRFEIDLDAGRVLEEPADIGRVERLTSRVHYPIWHPRKELLAFRRREGRIDVLTTDGTPVTWLRVGGWPRAWFVSDDSLLVARGTAPEVYLERWQLNLSR